MNVSLKDSILSPVSFTLQWHITERCNWHCRHCYQDQKYIRGELSLKSLFKIFKQYLELIKHFDTLGLYHAGLNLTGGEPLLRKDFFPFLEELHKHNKYFVLSVFSNGSLINKENARRLKSLGIETVQVSLEGMEINNDAIRGKGAFLKTIGAIEVLVESKMNVVVSLTLTKQNLSDIPSLVKLCKKLGVSRLGTRRLVPIGRGKEFIDYLLTPLELKRFYWYVEKENRRGETGDKKPKFLIVRGCEEGVFYQETGRSMNNCGVTTGRVLVILSNGDILPCRRLPVKVGNALKNTLINVYYSSTKLRELRNLNNAYYRCQECSYFERCLSGARCIAYAYFNRLSAPDPQCWKLFQELPSTDLLRHQKDTLDERQRVYFELLPGVKR